MSEFEVNPDKCLSNLPKQDNPFRLADTPEDVELAKQLQQELNEISSLPVTVYLLIDTTIDNLYGESKNPRYGSPISNVVGHYSPMSLKFELNKWGLDTDTDLVIYFTKDEVINKCGRLIQQGDLIYDTKLQRLFEVTEQNDDTNFNFEFINQYVFCKRKLGDVPTLGGSEYQQPKEGQDVASTEELDNRRKDNFYSY